MAAPGIVLHLGFLAWNVFAIWNILEVTDAALNRGEHAYGGRWKYLTFLNQIFQTVFFGVCLLCDLLQLCFSNRNRFCSILTRLKDFLFTTLVFPIGAFVFSVFWSMYAYDRELHYPIELDLIIPLWVNHAMHTFIFPPLLIELFSCSHHYPSKKNGVAVLLVFCTAYTVTVYWVHYAAGIWVYPIMAKMNALGQLVWCTSAHLITLGFYYLGEWLTRLRWGSEHPSNKKNN